MTKLYSTKNILTHIFKHISKNKIMQAYIKRKHLYVFTYIYICASVCAHTYIYRVIHRQICFVLSELISVARQYLPVAGIETRLTQTPSESF